MLGLVAREVALGVSNDNGMCLGCEGIEGTESVCIGILLAIY